MENEIFTFVPFYNRKKRYTVTIVGNKPRYTPYMNLSDNNETVIGSVDERTLKQLKRSLNKRLIFKPLNLQLSRDCRHFFQVEIRNENDGGVSPATLNSAYHTFIQSPNDVLLQWCGYRDDYGDTHECERFHTELGNEIRRLMRHYGKRYELQNNILFWKL